MQSAPVLSSDRCHTDAPAGIAYCELRLNTNKGALVISTTTSTTTTSTSTTTSTTSTTSTTTAAPHPRSQAITDLFESVALQQAALSHILNAEGEKLQKILSFEDLRAETILQTNQSVESMVNAVAGLETVLKQKLELFEACMCDDSHL